MPNSSPSKAAAMDGVFFGGFDKQYGERKRPERKS
jgi:hypothetical protein